MSDQSAAHIHWLRTELERRRSLNQNYSMRAFARDSGLSPGFLTQILKGSRRLTETRAAEIGLRLEWSAQKTKQFIRLVRLAGKGTKNEVLRQEILGSLGKKNATLAREEISIKAPAFDLLADWDVSAVLTLLCETGNKQTDRSIAKRLGLSLVRTRKILSKLIENQFVSRSSNGDLKVQHSFFRRHSMPSASIREHHRQFLGKAEEALEAQHFSEREFTGLTFNVDSKQLSKAKRRIQEFQDEMYELLSSTDDSDSVYRFSIQLFRLDRGKNE